MGVHRQLYWVVSMWACARGYVCLFTSVSWSRNESECVFPRVCDSVRVVCACRAVGGEGCKASMYSCADCVLHNSRGTIQKASNMNDASGVVQHGGSPCGRMAIRK